MRVSTCMVSKVNTSVGTPFEGELDFVIVKNNIDGKIVNSVYDLKSRNHCFVTVEGNFKKRLNHSQPLSGCLDGSAWET